jgi:hypothetical protein
MPDLRKTIRKLTEDFADSVASSVEEAIRERASEFAEGLLEALRSASLSDIVGGGTPELPPARRAPARREPRRKGVRRSDTEINDLAEEIVDLCKKHPDGVKAEEMRAVLKVENRDLQRPIFLLLKRGTVKKTGQKRATLYFSAA